MPLKAFPLHIVFNSDANILITTHCKELHNGFNWKQRQVNRVRLWRENEKNHWPRWSFRVINSREIFVFLVSGGASNLMVPMMRNEYSPPQDNGKHNDYQTETTDANGGNDCEVVVVVYEALALWSFDVLAVWLEIDLKRRKIEHFWVCL